MSSYRSAGKRGSVLIVALWALFFLSCLAVVIYMRVTPALSAAKRIKQDAQLYCLTRAAVARAAAEVRQDEDTGVSARPCDTLSSSWCESEKDFKDVALADEGFFSLKSFSGYGLVDEERKINLNTASAAVLANLFRYPGGMAPEDAAAAASAAADWRDSDNSPAVSGAENEYYMSLPAPYSCKSGAFESNRELMLVKGMTPQVYENIRDYITVYSSGAVNINTADAVCLKALGISDVLAGKIIGYRLSAAGSSFEDTAGVAGKLSAAGLISAEEAAQLSAVLQASQVSVFSDNFSSVACAKTVSGMTSETEFVVDRKGSIKYWMEKRG